MLKAWYSLPDRMLIVMYTHCPLCGNDDASPWARENGFEMGKCRICGLLYVNPRPSDAEISDSNRVGVHRGEDGALDVSSHYKASKKARYSKVIHELFGADWAEGKPISWLDVGAGYGEVVAAVRDIAPEGSTVSGIEPMQPKVRKAQEMGLPVTTQSLDDITGQFDVISLINVYSHVPDFLGFGEALAAKLNPGGVLFVETGNGADLASRDQFPDLLYLPDHLVFTAPSQMRMTFDKIGLSLDRYEEKPVDSLIWCLKTAVNSALRGKLQLQIPGRSPFRTVFYKARKPAAA